MNSVTPFLMFSGEQYGKAEEAIGHYCSIFENARVIYLDHYRPGDNEPEGSVRRAEFEIGGQRVKAIDSAMEHAFTFTPAISLWVECSSEAELERTASALGGGGSILMPLDNYGFSRKFCWVADRYGVTWQLNLR